MNISRKEFFSKGVTQFSRDMFRAFNGVDQSTGTSSELTPHAFLTVDNSRCLAQRGGCFCCIDHCPQEAVGIKPGVGIEIDDELCDGCGECMENCPVEPKVIVMKQPGE